MIEVLPIKNDSEIKDFYNKNGIEFTENAGVTVAKCGEEVLGYCAFKLEKDKITLIKTEPENDIMLFDGILRSALHIADNRGITEAFYLDDSYTDTLSKLGFIKNKEKKSLKIEKLHESCCSCEKNNN